MLLKPADLVIDPQNPFKDDAFERKEVVEAFVNLIGTLSGPFVLTVDAPWGTGKTTFLKMLAACLENAGHPCLHFNAWETDFAEDPLIAFVGEMDQLIRNISADEADKLERWKKVKRIGSALAKRAVVAAVKVGTINALDLEKESEKFISDATGDAAEDAVDSYLKERKHIDEFHKAIDQALALVEEKDKTLPLVFIVDELDRCRPLYAIELLERIKHLFNVEKAIFVLALDKEQLGISLSAVYGQGFNSNEYLRRFFDIEFRLSQVDSDIYCKQLISRMALDQFFTNRGPDDQNYFEHYFRQLTWLFGFSARTQERLMALLVIAMLSIKSNQSFFPVLTVLMASIKLFNPLAYEAVTQNGASVMKWISIISTQESIKGKLLAQDRGYLIGAILNNRGKDAEASNYLSEIGNRDRVNQTSDDERFALMALQSTYSLGDIKLIAKRIDLAAQLSSPQR